MSRYTLNIPRRLSQAVDTYRAASEAYAAARDESGEGASTFPEGTIFAGPHPVARVSYNGRVWALGEWKEGDKPLYDPAALGFSRDEAEAIVTALEPGIRALAKQVWADHPNNPANRA